MNLDRIYILDATDRNMDILRLDDGGVALHCGAYLSATDAKQLTNALMALASGQFDRATTEYCLQFEFARRRPQSDSDSTTTPQPQPELDTL